MYQEEPGNFILTAVDIEWTSLSWIFRSGVNVITSAKHQVKV